MPMAWGPGLDGWVKSSQQKDVEVPQRCSKLQGDVQNFDFIGILC